MRSSYNRNTEAAGLALLSAIIIVLQFLSAIIRFGPFSLSFVLVPIVIGAAIYGKTAGAFLGAVFSTVVIFNCITGADAGGATMLNANPPLTIFLCLLKGILAGWAAGAVYDVVAKKDKYMGAFFAAAACPVVNTSIFLLFMYFFYKDILMGWAGDTPVLYFLIFTLAGINFLLELTLNIVLCPSITGIIRFGKSMNPSRDSGGRHNPMKK